MQALGKKPSLWNFNLPSLKKAAAVNHPSIQSSLFSLLLSVLPGSFGFFLSSSALCHSSLLMCPQASRGADSISHWQLSSVPAGVAQLSQGHPAKRRRAPVLPQTLPQTLGEASSSWSKPPASQRRDACSLSSWLLLLHCSQ